MELLLPAIIFISTFLIIFITYIINKKQYEQTEYYKQTKNPYMKVRFDKGLLGEFYTYKCLKTLEGHKRYLFNLYIPNKKGQTTELDVVLLHESGIYVFESKNYSGWIFGTESQQYWTQTLPDGNGQSQKRKFFNPILQNQIHIKYLKAFLSDQTLPIYSYIVFSDRCTLKKITLTSGMHCVINRHNLLYAVQKNIIKNSVKLSPYKIDTLYKKLYHLTQTSEEIKLMHIQNIRNFK